MENVTEVDTFCKRLFYMEFLKGNHFKITYQIWGDMEYIDEKFAKNTSSIKSMQGDLQVSSILGQ